MKSLTEAISKSLIFMGKCVTYMHCAMIYASGVCPSELSNYDTDTLGLSCWTLGFLTYQE